MVSLRQTLWSLSAQHACYFHAGLDGAHPSIAAMVPLKIRHRAGFCMKHTAPPPLKLCACMRFMSPMQTAVALPFVRLTMPGMVTAHLLWSVEVLQPRPASRMYTCLMLRDSYADCGGQLEGRGFQPFSQLCISNPAIATHTSVPIFSQRFPHFLQTN